MADHRVPEVAAERMRAGSVRARLRPFASIRFDRRVSRRLYGRVA